MRSSDWSSDVCSSDLARNAGLLGRFGETIENVPAQPQLLDTQLAAAAVMCACAAPMILTFLEDGQHGIPTPFRIAAELCPLVIVARLATHVDHAVDRRRAAENPPARIQDRAPAEPGVELRLIAPIGAWIADAIKIADWNMNPDPVVLAAGFEQQHQHVGICRQAIGEYAAGAAATDDDVVEAAEIFHARLSNVSRCEYVRRALR